MIKAEVQSYRNGKGRVAGGKPLNPGCLPSSRLRFCLPQTMLLGGTWGLQGWLGNLNCLADNAVDKI